MRILFVDSGLDWRGGQYQVLNLGAELLKRGHEMLLVCQSNSALERRVKDRNIPVETVRTRGDVDIPAWFRLGGMLRAFEPDIVHAHTARAHAVALGATFFHDVGALVVTRRVASPIRRTLLNRLKYSGFVTGFVAISGFVGRTLETAGVPSERIRVIPSSVRLSDFEALESTDDTRRELGLAGDERVVLNVGSLSKEKAQEDILLAASVISQQVPRVRFLVAGEGRLRSRLERRARELNVDSVVRLLGFRDDIPQLMRLSDIFLFPSESEGLGTSVLEAMAAGLPVVASGKGGTREIVHDGETGFLVEPHDVSSMAEAVMTLLRDPELAHEMGQKAGVLAQEFSFARSCESHEGLYRELAG